MTRGAVTYTWRGGPVDPDPRTSRGSGGSWEELTVLHVPTTAAYRILAHGGVGNWDEYALLLLAPLVIAAVLWVTRRSDDDE